MVHVYFHHLGFIFLGNGKLISMAKTKAFLAKVLIGRSINIDSLVSNIQSALVLASYTQLSILDIWHSMSLKHSLFQPSDRLSSCVFLEISTRFTNILLGKNWIATWVSMILDIWHSMLKTPTGLAFCPSITF